MTDYLFVSRDGSAFRDALRVLSAPKKTPSFGPNPLGLSEAMLAKIAAWNEAQRKGGSSDGNL